MAVLPHRSPFRFLSWLYLAIVLVFLYLPLVPPVLNSLALGPDASLFSHYRAITQSSILMEGIRKTWLLGVLTALITPLFALAIAAAIRAWKVPRLLVGLILIPLFVPGVSMGVATALFFRLLGLSPSLFTMTVVHVLWALPFATLLLLTIMASYDRVYTEAAYMLGASPWHAFFEIERPQYRTDLYLVAIPASGP